MHTLSLMNNWLSGVGDLISVDGSSLNAERSVRKRASSDIRFIQRLGVSELRTMYEQTRTGACQNKRGNWDNGHISKGQVEYWSQQDRVRAHQHQCEFPDRH